MIHLDYMLKTHNQNTLSVSIDISGNRENCKLIFICAGIEMLNLRCFDGESFFSPIVENGILYVREETRNISYLAVIGAGGKHGYQGILEKDYGAFEISRAMALPHPTKYPSEEPLPFECKFTTCLSGRTEKIYKYFDSVYSVANFRKNSIFYTNSPLIIGKIKLFMQRYDEEIYNRTTEIICFFESLFGFSLIEYKLFLLNNESKPIFGGAGENSAAFSTQAGKERDFELIAHRLFHAFFAKTKYAKEYFLPPYSFIEEGYASLYEILATKANPKKSIYCLYKRYLFYYFAKPNFRINPANEIYMQESPWLIEFLHYTLSPLIMYAFNRKFEPCSAAKLFKELDAAGLISANPLFLPDFKQGYDEIEAISVAELNDFEHIISSWQGRYEKTNLLHNIPPPTSELEQKLYNISPSLYKLIKSAGGIL